jgi:SAM-dependent methyltransferase
VPSCPLCRSGGARLSEVVATSDLSGLWRTLGIEVDHLYAGASLALHVCAECDLRFFDGARPGDQAFYASLNAKDWYYMEEKPEFQFARSKIAAGEMVLEVGAGAAMFARTLTGASYTGLEFSESARRAAQATGVALLDQSIEAHAATHAGRYDVVCHFQVLEHVADCRSFLEACVACLKPRGRLMVAVPAHDSFLQVTTNNLLNLPPHHLTLWSDAALRSAGRLLRLDLLELMHEPVAEFHRAGYLHAWLSYLSHRMLGRNPKLVDRGTRQRLVSRAAGAASRRLLGHVPSFMYGAGHTVSAIFQRQ